MKPDNPHPRDSCEWLAEEALQASDGEYVAAIDRLRDALDVLIGWSQMVNIANDNDPSDG